MATQKTNRYELYKQGFIFIRPRNVEPRGSKNFMGGTQYQIMISESFGSWKVFDRFWNEEDRDMNLDEFRQYPEKYIVED